MESDQRDVLKERYRASLVLAGVGDALGYNNGSWEFTFSGPAIHNEYNEIGGLEKIDIKSMIVSDDQVMHIATGRALVESSNFKELVSNLSKRYVESFTDMVGRAPGPTTGNAVRLLKYGKEIPYSGSGGGCGGSMRSMCIGLRFPHDNQIEELVAASIESGRLTHNHPTGFLGALVSSLFTAYAIENIPPIQWGRKMVKDVLPKAYKYLEVSGKHWSDYQRDLKFFENSWTDYLKLRQILDDQSTQPTFPENYGVAERDNYYNSISYSGWGGASGNDSTIIAYDALLGSANNFNELVLKGVLHGGDNDSTGAICCAWWGAIYGFEGVPPRIYQNVEKAEEAIELADKLFDMVYHEPETQPTSTTTTTTTETDSTGNS